MKIVILVFILGTALLLSAGVIGLLLLWVRGSKTVLLPGLGFLIAMPFLLVILAAVAMILIGLAVVIWRY
jgi:hypothetical protein